MHIMYSKYPGDRDRWVICDNCGRKVHRKDVILINDPYGPLNNMLVCKGEAEYISAGMKPYTVRPSVVPNSKYVRPVQQIAYSNAQTISDVENRTGSYSTGSPPDAPSQLEVYVDFEGYVTLQWIMLGSPNGSNIIGHKIERESPIGGGWSTIEDNTNLGASIYQDLTATSGHTYNYRVSAINDFGTGDPSTAKSLTI